MAHLLSGTAEQTRCSSCHTDMVAQSPGQSVLLEVGAAVCWTLLEALCNTDPSMYGSILPDAGTRECAGRLCLDKLRLSLQTGTQRPNASCSS